MEITVSILMRIIGGIHSPTPPSAAVRFLRGGTDKRHHCMDVEVSQNSS